MTFAPVPSDAPAPILGPSKTPFAQPDRDEWCDEHPWSDLREAIDDDLSVKKVQAGSDHYWIPDRDLRDGHGGAMEQPWQNGHAECLQTRLGAIAHLREQRVRDDEQPEDLYRFVDGRPELVTLGPVRRRHPRVGPDRLEELGVAGAHGGQGVGSGRHDSMQYRRAAKGGAEWLSRS